MGSNTSETEREKERERERNLGYYYKEIEAKEVKTAAFNVKIIIASFL